MSPDPTTLLAYSTVLFLIFGLYFTAAELAHGKTRKAFWYSSPFLAASVSGFFFTSPFLIPGLWGLRIGAVFMTLAYGLGWQAIRTMLGRRTCLKAVLIVCLVSLAISASAASSGTRHIVSSIVRMLFITGFHFQAARDLLCSTEKQTSAERLLCRIIAFYTLVYGVLTLSTPFLPEPLGSQPSTVWAIILYNFLVIIEGIVIALAMIAIPRERLAAEHHLLTLQDPLTHAGNRRAMDVWMEQNTDSSHPCVLFLMDIDHFKAINDRHGHAAGDQVIIAAVRASQKVLPQEAKFFRIGGEEFAALFPFTSISHALELAHRLKKTFTQDVKNIGDRGIEATLSIGADIRYSSKTLWSDVWQKADAALYAAKGTGRDAVVLRANDTITSPPFAVETKKASPHSG
ncbi:diguanylate cyclase [Gluconobacter japonicus]|uniref:GGDEF domain-containing protein n=1 Tax=Gluconobacter japonicus TaxID=376620 RepID=UPI0039E7BF9A